MAPRLVGFVSACSFAILLRCLLVCVSVCLFVFLALSSVLFFLASQWGIQHT